VKRKSCVRFLLASVLLCKRRRISRTLFPVSCLSPAEQQKKLNQISVNMFYPDLPALRVQTRRNTHIQSFECKPRQIVLIRVSDVNNVRIWPPPSLPKPIGRSAAVCVVCTHMHVCMWYGYVFLCVVLESVFTQYVSLWHFVHFCFSVFLKQTCNWCLINCQFSSNFM